MIEEKLNRLEEIPAAFVNKVTNEQKNIYKTILIKLDLLKKKNGKILVTKDNIRIATEISNSLITLLSNGQYKEFVRSFISEFDIQADINDAILKAELNNIIISDKSTLILSSMKKIATENLISSSVLTSVLAAPIKDEVERAVINNLSIADLTENIRLITVGDKEQLGRLERYANQISYDALATTDRAYTKSISEDNGIEFYRYSGRLLKNSRSFCESRNNKYYHIKEIESWGNLNWEGRIKGTNSSNIFTNLGGYRCQHSLIPVSLARVPKDILKKNLSNGNLSLNEKQKEILGLSI